VEQSFHGSTSNDCLNISGNDESGMGILASKRLKPATIDGAFPIGGGCAAVPIVIRSRHHWGLHPYDLVTHVTSHRCPPLAHPR
jgi:hypothetical protein